MSSAMKSVNVLSNPVTDKAINPMAIPIAGVMEKRIHRVGLRKERPCVLSML